MPSFAPHSNSARLTFSLLCPLPLFHNNLSWGEFDKTKLREPKEPDDAQRGERESERGKNSVIYLTLFINFPFLALVTRLQRSFAGGTYHDITQGDARGFGIKSPRCMITYGVTLNPRWIPANRPGPRSSVSPWPPP